MPLKSYYETQYGLKRNPFPNQATYAQDTQMIYVPEMFGPDRGHFIRKFIMAPLENGQPLIGAVWSVIEGDPSARGFGKSTLMAEEAKIVNRDFGKSTLMSVNIPENDAQQNPILAGYASFDTKSYGGIASIDAAAFGLAKFILQTKDENGVSTHSKLRERAVAQLFGGGEEPENAERAIVREVKDKFENLSVTIDIRNLLEEYLYHLASPDTDSLLQFLASDVSTWHHDRNGLKYLQILVALGQIAGIQQFTFFIDQIEDFTTISGPEKIKKNVKIIRDALFESEPFSSCASFVFQLHPSAWYKMQNAWAHEDLPDLDYSNPMNRPVVLLLKGLEQYQNARILVERILTHPSVALPGRVDGISPFTESALEYIWSATKPKPRTFLRTLNRLLEIGSGDRVPILNNDFVEPLLGEVISRVESDQQPTSEEIDERTA